MPAQLRSGTTPGSATVATSTDPPITTEYLLEQALLHLGIAEYPIPFGLQTARTIVYTKCWGPLIVYKGVKWADIETSANTPGIFLLAFRDALAREFSLLEATHQAVLRDLVQRFRDIAEVVIFHDRVQVENRKIKIISDAAYI